MDITINKTKIVATYGPACSDFETMKAMVKAGVDVFRFNFSHGDHNFHLEGMNKVKQINDQYNLNICILADLQGPKIRVGDLGDGIELENGSELSFTTDESKAGERTAYINYQDLAKDVSAGEHILLDDGTLELEVIDTNKKDMVRTKVVTGGLLKSRKGVNLPQTKISLPCLTEKDRVDLEFAIQQEANWIALSFVRSAMDVVELKKIIGKKNHHMKVISKIEKPEAVEDIDDIIDVTDGIMIARGDLGVEVPMERVPMIQKDIINRCLRMAKPVVVATQMMDSMIENPNPTRAEVTDVANAVIDGADAVMLSGETSVGKFPTRVIETMEKVLRNVEQGDLIYHKKMDARRQSPTFLSDAVCYNACELAADINAKAIVGMTVSGYTGFMVSSCRPKAEIYIFTQNKHMLNTLNLLWGVRAFYYNRFVSTDVTIRDVNKILRKNGLVKRGDLILNTASMPLREQGRTNMIKVTKVK